MEEFEKRITEVMQIPDEEERKKEVKTILLDLRRIIRDKNNGNSNERRQLLCNMNLDLSLKLRFFILASKILHSAYYYDSSHRLELELIQIYGKEDYFDLCFNDSVLDFGYYKKEFIDELKKDLELQKKFSEYFKIIHYRGMAENDDRIKEIFNLPHFKNIVFSDEKFVCDYLGEFHGYTGNMIFFENLPKEYRYLICLCKLTYGNLNYLYDIHFRDSLSPEAREEFCELQDSLEYNPFGVSRLYRMRELKKALKNVLADNEFYPKMKSIQAKANLDFKSAVNFAGKYYGTAFFEELLGYEIFNADMQEKIGYLSRTRKMKNVEQLEKIENISIQDLKKMEKEKSEAVIFKITGGPVGKTNIHFDPDCGDTEIRRINKDGSVKKSSHEGKIGNHYPCLKDVYGNIFGYEKPTQECTVIAVKRFGSVTWVIEMENALIYTPEKPTIEQKRVIIDWLKGANSEGRVGIFAYDSEQDGCIILNEDDELTDPISAIEYILELEDSREIEEDRVTNGETNNSADEEEMIL